MSTFKEANPYKQSIDERFTEFHRLNPHIYSSFCGYVRQAIGAGRKKTSAKLIMNRMRWDEHISTERTDHFKINDAFISRYVRMYLQFNPQHSYLFELRSLRS